jgi:hypothetical protein
MHAQEKRPTSKAIARAVLALSDRECTNERSQVKRRQKEWLRHLWSS